ncbi:hypothetical protein E2C01_049086 [Portunus trituberculatus]|uniref:Uncharacterized protein n=1 Tax=Portunus trituberculatus TaxID=210409 RepID=A0A5B7GCQ8_PORTR|nr:hypothetical protein [Portunus trituberculatus]
MYLTHRYLLTRDPQPYCDDCLVPLTVRHQLLSALAIITLDMPTHPPGGLRCPPLLATCCPSPYLCLLEEDQPATTSVLPTQDYPQGS